MENLNNLGEADLTYLDELAGGNREFMREIIELFVKQTPVDLALLHEFIDQKDWQQVANQAHRIKPTLNYVGAVALREEIQQLENNASHKSNVEDIKIHMENLQPRFDALVAILGNVAATL